MNEYTFYFLDGVKKVLRGSTVQEAFSSAYSAGALRAVDFFAEGNKMDDEADDYYYNKSEHAWRKKDI